jgi:hypothetical protein
MYEWKTNKYTNYLFSLLIMYGIFYMDGHVVSSDMVRGHHISRHNTPIHNILSTAPQLNISQQALGTLPEDGNVMPKYVGATIHN